MRKFIAAVIAVVPVNLLRIALYNLVLGYRLSYSAKIGFGTVIATRSAAVRAGARIGRFNRFSGPFDLAVGERARIGNYNEFRCIADAAGDSFCTLGRKVHVTNNHFFDASNGLRIEDETRIAGRDSQFWTHGGQRRERTIVLREKCYVASGARFAPGVEIAANSFVGLGSVVVDSFAEPNVLIFGNPAAIVKRNIVARRSLADVRGSDALHPDAEPALGMRRTAGQN